MFQSELGLESVPEGTSRSESSMWGSKVLDIRANRQRRTVTLFAFSSYDWTARQSAIPWQNQSEHPEDDRLGSRMGERPHSRWRANSAPSVFWSLTSRRKDRSFQTSAGRVCPADDSERCLFSTANASIIAENEGGVDLRRGSPSMGPRRTRAQRQPAQSALQILFLRQNAEKP